MPKRWQQPALAAALAASLAAAAWAETPPKPPKPPAARELPPSALADRPGYVDFGTRDLFERADLAVEVQVTAPMLRMVSTATRNAEPDLADMLEALEGIEVQVFRVAPNRRTEVLDHLRAQADRMGERGWVPALSLRLERDEGWAFLRRAKVDGVGKTLGLAAMYITADDQAIFLNIVGPIDPARVAELARRLELDLFSGAATDGSGDGAPD